MPPPPPSYFFSVEAYNKQHGNRTIVFVPYNHECPSWHHKRKSWSSNISCGLRTNVIFTVCTQYYLKEIVLFSCSKPETPGAHGSKEVKGKTHTYYQVLIDTRDCPHIVSTHIMYICLLCLTPDSDHQLLRREIQLIVSDMRDVQNVQCCKSPGLKTTALVHSITVKHLGFQSYWCSEEFHFHMNTL